MKAISHSLSTKRIVAVLADPTPLRMRVSQREEREGKRESLRVRCVSLLLRSESGARLQDPPHPRAQLTDTNQHRPPAGGHGAAAGGAYQKADDARLYWYVTRSGGRCPTSPTPLTEMPPSL